jgi:hypothetical protein
METGLPEETPYDSLFAKSLDSQDGVYRLCNIRIPAENLSNQYYDEFNEFQY